MSSDPPVPDTGENTDSKDLVFGRTVVPVANRNKAPKKGKLGFEYVEHCFIGDAITLTLASGGKVAASDYRFQLKNQLSLTYGQINGLAGDFYGTYYPISDGKTDQDRSARFVRAYNTLADGGSHQPKEAMDILRVLEAEVDADNAALANRQDPSVVYAKLPDINWDHFGVDARAAYNTGHAAAIQKVISGDLDGAHAMNAFADHFLEDLFSAGHLRTPRRFLHRSIDVTADAWTHAPTLESANAHQLLATIFTFKNERRKVIENRRLWNFKTDWWFSSTAIECKTSCWWNYPITINGLQNIVPWSAQPGGGISQNEHLDGLWGRGPSKGPIFNAVLFTPLAAINFNGGKRFASTTSTSRRWFPGELGGMKIQAATNTSIAAVQYGDDQGGVHIRVYCQELVSGAIKELCNDGYWFRGATLPVALSGSSLAVVAYSWNGL
ncbi:uncharacterized protein ARMOST_13626 [Armillaria ostoyae]|uniref:Uncharacterized protein n=1 Tax=Armillaria ostoyae TaxID=47428 RepID=A0A284RN93_ARMOS|nr:uncharacterized protein ARMOST_13626 [Armillaria ostoyae]